MSWYTRRPPREPNWRVGKGLCVWCGGKLEGRRRSWCSDACVAEYRIANFAGDAASQVFRRDQGKCASCGSTPADRYRWRQNCALWTQSRWISRYRWPEGWDGEAPVTWIERTDPGWEADHIVPLWSVDRDAPDAFRFWTLANLQTLCLPCHKAKTAREAAQRAASRRAPVAKRGKLGRGELGCRT